MDYNLKDDYEVISKHCPRCQILVMARIVRTIEGEFYKYRDAMCPSCGWNNSAVPAADS